MSPSGPQARIPAGRAGYPVMPEAGAPGGASRWPAPLAPAADLAVQPLSQADTDARLRVRLAERPVAGEEWAPSARQRAGTTPHASGGAAARAADHARPTEADLWNRDSLRLAKRILDEASTQAAGIRDKARQDAAAMLAAAQQEAATARQQAAATLAAAELEAAEKRTVVMRLSAELGQVASYVTENLTAPATSAVQSADPPAVRSAERSAPRPGDRPATRRAGLAVGRPAPRPTTRPADSPVDRPAARPRQFVAMRLTVIATAAVTLLAAAAGSAQIALHGFRFFVFRAAGTGETPRSGLQEDQGPGQPDAPGAHHNHHVNTHKQQISRRAPEPP